MPRRSIPGSLGRNNFSRYQAFSAGFSAEGPVPFCDCRAFPRQPRV